MTGSQEEDDGLQRGVSGQISFGRQEQRRDSINKQLKDDFWPVEIEDQQYRSQVQTADQQLDRV